MDGKQLGYLLFQTFLDKEAKAKFNLQDRQSVREFVSGESHYFSGMRYLLNVIETTGSRELN